MAAVAKTGLQEVLILTGESRKYSDVKYIGEACKIARKYFKVIGLEVYPMNSDEYAYLHECVPSPPIPLCLSQNSIAKRSGQLIVPHWLLKKV